MDTPTISLPQSTDGVKWQTPEKIVSLGILLGGGLLVFKFLDVILPWINHILENTIEFIGLGAVLVLLLTVLANKQFRMGLSYLVRMAIRKLVGLFYTIDPIGTLELGIEDMEKARKTLEDHINVVAGNKEKVDRSIVQYNAEIEDDMRQGLQAKKMGKLDFAALRGKDAGGLKSIVDKLLILQQKLAQVLTFLEKLAKAADFNIESSKIDLKHLKIEYTTVTASYNAVKTAMNIFKGNPDKAFATEQATNFIEQDMSAKVGEMKRIMEASVSFTDSVDVQEGVYNEKGLEMLEQFEKGGLKLFDHLDETPASISSNDMLSPAAQRTVATAELSHDSLLS